MVSKRPRANASLRAAIFSRRKKFVIPTGANPDFLLRCRRQGRVCGFPQRKPHEVRGTH
jgi:hypothetical protein